MSCEEKELYPRVEKSLKSKYSGCKIESQKRTSTGSSIVDYLITCQKDEKIRIVGEVKACKFNINEVIKQINRYAKEYSAPGYPIKKYLFIPQDKNLSSEEMRKLKDNGIEVQKISYFCGC